MRKIIIRAMKRQDISQYRLAVLSKVPQSTISNFLAGKRDLTGERMGKLFDALKLRVVEPE